jgi:hypothetical protein
VTLRLPSLHLLCRWRRMLLTCRCGSLCAWMHSHVRCCAPVTAGGQTLMRVARTLLGLSSSQNDGMGRLSVSGVLLLDCGPFCVGILLVVTHNLCSVAAMPQCLLVSSPARTLCIWWRHPGFVAHKRVRLHSCECCMFSSAAQCWQLEWLYLCCRSTLQSGICTVQYAVVDYVVQLLVPVWHIVVSLFAACPVPRYAPLCGCLIALLYQAVDRLCVPLRLTNSA